MAPKGLHKPLATLLARWAKQREVSSAFFRTRALHSGWQSRFRRDVASHIPTVKARASKPTIALLSAPTAFFMPSLPGR